MITRRDTFVAALAAGATATGFLLPWQRIGTWAGLTTAGTGLGAPFEQVLASLDGTGAVGSAWLDAQSRDWDTTSLAALLGQRLGPDLTSRDIIEQRIAGAIRADFAERRLCNVAGWQLSQTECELAGLRWLALGDAPGRAAVDDASTHAETATATADTLIAEVTDWGPRGTEQGVPFNLQSDGHSGLWFAAKDVPNWVVIRIDGVEAATTINETTVTSGLFGALKDRILATPGRYPIEFYDPMKKRVQPIGDLVIRERAERMLRADGSRSGVFCPVTGWGPSDTVAGVAANPLPDGSLGMWFALACAPRNVQLCFGDDRLAATRGDTAVTARVPLALIESARTVPLRLRDADTGEELVVGDFRIVAPGAQR